MGFSPATRNVILHSTFYILHSTFYILHSTFYILHSTSYILHHTFYIIPLPAVIPEGQAVRRTGWTVWNLLKLAEATASAATSREVFIHQTDAFFVSPLQGSVSKTCTYLRAYATKLWSVAPPGLSLQNLHLSWGLRHQAIEFRPSRAYSRAHLYILGLTPPSYGVSPLQGSLFLHC